MTAPKAARAVSALADDDPRLVSAGERDNKLSKNIFPKSQVLSADLIGSDMCSAAGITARAGAPVLELCRRLVEAGHDPNTKLQVNRDGVLVLVVSSIGEAARFTVEDDKSGRPRLRLHRDQPRRGGAAPPVRNPRSSRLTTPNVRSREPAGPRHG